jgi:3-deoxy-manno-octulosonate cytidylyltransferase (CMP-KDO synthetase)
MSGFAVVIPARYASTRLPGKTLLDIGGRPMLAHVHDLARASGADPVIVATDDERVAVAAEAFGARVRMTSPRHASGTDRAAEVVAEEGWGDAQVVVNVQADEPLLPPALVVQVAQDLAAFEEAGIATLRTSIDDAGSVFDPSVVKVVCDEREFALYFSRAPIPWHRDAFAQDRSLPPGSRFDRHIGLYAYRAGTLRALAARAPAAIESAESLEQLRALHAGIRIRVPVARELPGHGVDTPADLERVRALVARGAAG